jgi:curli biogenesis system outer membrane secretion channel CsgG
VGLKTIAVLLAVSLAACALPETPRQVGNEAPVSVEKQRHAQQELALPEKKGYKRKIAIGRFTNETNYGKGLLRDLNYDPLGKQTSDILSADLVNSGRFIVLERPDLDKLIAEQKMTGRADLVGADSLILGSVTEFGRTTEGKQGFLSSTKIQRANAKVTIRLVDPATGQVFFSASGAGEATVETGEVAGFGSQADYDRTLNDKAIRAAIADVMDSLVSRLEDHPWKTYILSVGNGSVVIGGGSFQGLKIGDKLLVIEPGEKVKNPQTGFMVELPGKEVARLEVKSFFGSTETDEGSMCAIVSGNLAGLSIKDLYVTAIRENL